MSRPVGPREYWDQDRTQRAGQRGYVTGATTGIAKRQNIADAASGLYRIRRAELRQG
ncbi:MAG: hypothetical protein JO166_09010 [Deltaproteobacteria bacterium]|nr:hypothetical protein [Deltaproteobacteria bacterium]